MVVAEASVSSTVTPRVDDAIVVLAVSEPSLVRMSSDSVELEELMEAVTSMEAGTTLREIRSTPMLR